MSTETLPVEATPAPDSHIIPGTLIVGADAIDRADVARRVVLSLFKEDERAALVYVGADWTARLLRGELPSHRLGGAVAAMADVTAKGGAVVHGFDTQEEESRYGALCMIRAAFYLIQGRARKPPFILALDGFTKTVEEGRKARFNEALSAAITAPAVIPVLCFESFAEIEECFGGFTDFTGDALGLLMRFENHYILRSDFDTGGLETFWRFDIPSETAGELPRGRVLVIRQGYDASSSCATLHQETVDLDRLDVTAR